jgi:hypothetical protein
MIGALTVSPILLSVTTGSQGGIGILGQAGAALDFEAGSLELDQVPRMA